MDVTLSNTFHPSNSLINNSSEFLMVDERKRKIKACLSDMENPFESLV